MSFDFRQHPLEHLVTLEMPAPTVLQGFAVDERTDEIYATQLVPSPHGSAESFCLSRHSPDGALLDSLVLVHGGHGTTIALQHVDGRVHVWSLYERVDENGDAVGQDLVRFAYAPGTLTPDSPALTRFDRFSPHPFFVAGDEKNGTIAIWDTGPDADDHIEVRTFADLERGVDRPVHTLHIAGGLVAGSREWTQGVALDGTDLYWYLGDNTDGDAVPTEILRFDLATGDVTAREPVDLGRAHREHDYQEAEGVQVYTGPDGARSLVVGIVTGRIGARVRMLYAFHGSAANAERFRSPAR